MQRRAFVVQTSQLLLLSGLATVPLLAAADAEPIVGLPCEGCDAVFVGLPAQLKASTRIAASNEPGEPLVLSGRVLDTAGKPTSGIIVYAYHTDASGHYPPDPATRATAAQDHGRLRNWVRSDADGRYRFETLRPGGYPGRKDPQHIHLHVIEPGRCTYYIDDVVFTDDPRMADAGVQQKLQHIPNRGGSGITHPRRDAQGVWQVERDIQLGANIAGYPALRG